MLKLVIDKLEDVDEKVRELYVEKESEVGGVKKKQYVLDAEIEDTAGLKSALDKTRNDLKAAKTAAAKWDKLGDPEKAAAALAKVETLEEEEAQKKGKWDELKEAMKLKHADELKAVNEKSAAKDKHIEKLLVDQVLSKAFGEAKAKPSSIMKKLVPLAKPNIKVQYENGEPVAVVVDEKGNPRIGDGKGSPMTIEQYVAELKADPDYGTDFEATGTSGSGASTKEQARAAATGGPARTVSISDQEALNANFMDIAKGNVTVVGG